MIIHLEKCILRRPEPRDTESLYAYRNNPEVVSNLCDFSWGYSQENLAEWIEYHRKNQEDLIWIVADLKDKCIGHCGLYQIDFRVGVAEYGICIGMPEYRRQKLGEIVSRGVINYAFNQLNLRRLRLRVLANNYAAISLYQKLGFKKEGTLREEQFRNGTYVDVHLFGLLKSDYHFTLTTSKASAYSALT